MKNKIIQLWKEREFRSFVVLIIIITSLLLMGPFFSDNNPLSQVDNRLLLIFTLVIGWGIFNWWQLHRDKTQQPPQHFFEQHDEVYNTCTQVKQNVAAAVSFLKERLSHSVMSWRAFHHVPWYLVIGSVGSGKTRLLANAELGFLDTEQFVQFTPQGSTTASKINWWFAPSAVMIDVPGSYLEHGQALTANRAAWLELLRQIKRFRWRRAINGVVIVIDVEKILSLAKDTSYSELAIIRARLHEIIHRLKQPVPVYIICSQADKIQGFAEYFDDLGKSERQDKWGITFPLKNKLSISDLFNKAFDHFILNLHQRVLWRLHHERDRNKHSLIQQFPHQLNFLKENLQRIVYELSNLNQQLSLRGIYFTSAEMQENNTIDHIGDTVSKQFALLPIKHTRLAVPTQQPYFVKQVFDKQIFPESALANQTLAASLTRHDQLLRLGALGIAGIILMSAAILWSRHYQYQTQQLNTATIALSDYKLLALTYSTTADTSLDKLIPALNALQLAQNNAAKADLPWLLRFQLHHQQPLSAITTQLYQHDLQTRFIPGVRHLLAQQLHENNATNSAQLYNLLKAYLMLGDPTHADKTYLQHWLTFNWQNPITKNKQFIQHLNVALSGNLLPLASEQTLIDEARAALNALPYSLLSYAVFQSNLPAEDFQPFDIMPQQKSFTATQPIPKIYTITQLPIVDTKISDALVAAINGNWILGNKQSTDVTAQTIETLRQNLINNYAQDYSNAWQNWVNQIHLRPINSLGQLDVVLQEMISQSSSLAQLLSIIAVNTTTTGLNVNDVVLANALQNNLSPAFAAINALSDSHSASTIHIKDIIAILQALQQQIHQVTQAKTPGQAALLLLQDEMLSTKANPINQLDNVAKQVPQPLQGWLLGLATTSRNLLLQQAQSYLTLTWQQQVLSFYNTKIANRFPLQKNAQTSVELMNFQMFFEKDGILDQYVENNLTPFIDTTQAKWQWRLINGQPIIKNADLLAQLERASIIQKLYFDQHDQLIAPFNLQLITASPNIKEVKLTVNDRTITESTVNSTLHHFVWPTNTNNIQIAIIDQQGKTHMLLATGDWSLFELINAGQLKSSNDEQSYNVIFTIDGAKLEYVLTTASALNPFIPGIIDQFRFSKFE